MNWAKDEAVTAVIHWRPSELVIIKFSNFEGVG